MISNSPIDGSNIFLGGNLLDTDRVAEAFQVLDALYKSKALITIYTRYANYIDMAITSINIPRSPEQGNAIVFTIQATQVRIVTTQTTTLPPGVGVRSNQTQAGRRELQIAKTQQPKNVLVKTKTMANQQRKYQQQK